MFPQWVHTDADGFKEVSVGQVEGLEVEAIRTLKSENDEIKGTYRPIGERPDQDDRFGVQSRQREPLGSVGVLVGAGLVFATRRRRHSSVAVPASQTRSPPTQCREAFLFEPESFSGPGGRA